tara:strand:- start:14908 stop:15363 length:456 start_codon:yes stop_codon:yes gene_type:complete
VFEVQLRNVEECIAAARRERARRLARVKAFEEKYFGEPAWNILIETYILTVEGRGDIMMKHLVDPAKVPATTFSRYVDLLEEWGDLSREKTARDKRFTLVRLTDQGRDRIERSLSAMIREEERFIAPHRRDQENQLLPDRCFCWVETPKGK